MRFILFRYLGRGVGVSSGGGAGGGDIRMRRERAVSFVNINNLGGKHVGRCRTA